jgi:predicted DNA-binding protein
MNLNKKEKTSLITMRIKPALKKKIEAKATSLGQTLTMYITKLLEKEIEDKADPE